MSKKAGAAQKKKIKWYIKNLEKTIKNGNMNSVTLHKLSKYYDKLGNAYKAIEYLKLAAIDSEDPIVFEKLAVCYYELAIMSEVAKHCEKAIEYGSKNLMIFDILGSYWYHFLPASVDKIHIARTLLKAVEYGSKSPETLKILANIYLSLGDKAPGVLESKINDIRKSLKALSDSDKRDADTFILIAKLYYMAGNFLKTKAYYEKALELDNKNSGTYEALFYYPCKTENQFAKIEYAQKAAEYGSKNFGIHKALIEYYKTSNDKSLLRKHLESVIELGIKEPYCNDLIQIYSISPDISEIDRLEKLGHLYYITHKLPEAAGFYREAIKQGSTNPEIFSNLVKCGFKSPVKQNENCIRKYFEQLIENPHSHPEILLALGQCNYYLGNMGQMVRYFERAIKQNPLITKYIFDFIETDIINIEFQQLTLPVCIILIKGIKVNRELAEKSADKAVISEASYRQGQAYALYNKFDVDGFKSKEVLQKAIEFYYEAGSEKALCYISKILLNSKIEFDEHNIIIDGCIRYIIDHGGLNIGELMEKTLYWHMPEATGYLPGIFEKINQETIMLPKELISLVFSYLTGLDNYLNAYEKYKALLPKTDVIPHVPEAESSTKNIYEKTYDLLEENFIFNPPAWIHNTMPLHDPVNIITTYLFGMNKETYSGLYKDICKEICSLLEYEYPIDYCS